RPANVARAICDTTVSVSFGTMPYACDSSVMPTNIVIDITAIMTSVAAAFLLSGGLNAGTPFDTASTPVSAVQPLENAVSRTKTGNIVVPGGSGGSGGATGVSVPLK